MEAINDFNTLPWNLTHSSEYSESKRLDEALLYSRNNDSQSAYEYKLFDEFRYDVDCNDDLASTKVKRYITSGSSAVVFETEDGDVLKLTKGNHFPMNRPHESFDVPILKQGQIGNTRFYLEEKLSQHGLSEGFVQIMKDKIKSAGYRCSDLGDCDIHQIGMSKKGQLYLLDPECAKYKTIFHAIYDKAKRFLK